MLSKEVEAKLGGRYISKEIMTYSFDEFLRANNTNKAGYSVKEIGQINSLLNDYFVNGGSPESISFKNKREYISSIYQKVLYNDIIVHNNIRNENGIKLMIKKIAESVKQELSFTKIQNIITGIGEHKVSFSKAPFLVCFRLLWMSFMGSSPEDAWDMLFPYTSAFRLRGYIFYRC
jgi:predicted AAA+ superfamily ATPase